MIAIRDAQPLALLHSVCRSFLCHRWQRSSPCRCCEGMTITIDRPSYLGNSVWNRSWRLAWITWPSRPGWGRRWFKPARCWLWHLKSSASLWLSWTMSWWSKRWWWTHLPPSWQSRCSLPTTCQSPTAGFPHMKPPSASLSAQGSSLNPPPTQSVSQVKLLPMSKSLCLPGAAPPPHTPDIALDIPTLPTNLPPVYSADSRFWAVEGLQLELIWQMCFMKIKNTWENTKHAFVNRRMARMINLDSYKTDICFVSHKYQIFFYRTEHYLQLRRTLEERRWSKTMAILRKCFMGKVKTGERKI